MLPTHASTTESATESTVPSSIQCDVLVIGAGFAGLHALHELTRRGHEAVVLEAGAGVGGTWFWNRYPGSRCDVVSLDYSYTFSEELYQEWNWSERYAQQGEIEQYLNWVTDRLELRPHIRFGAKVVGATWSDETAVWTVAVADGRRFRAAFLVAATGCLSVPNVPHFDGLDDFEGDVQHTATWPSDGVDLAGKRVAVIGTGSSGIQLIPEVAKLASSLVVFQRTANFSLPAGQKDIDPDLVNRRKHALDAWRRKAWTSDAGFDFAPAELSADSMTREQAYAVLDRRWEHGGFPEIVLAFENVFKDPEANEMVSEYFRRKVRETVHDPATADLLCATDHPVGSKRVCADTNYYETYNRDNVTLVSTRSAPIDHFDRGGCVLADGRRFDLDVVVLATGFDAMTGALRRMGVVGRDGRTIEQAWAGGPRTLLGLQVVGFPNLFTITGPQSPSVLNNMVLGIEHHVQWIAGCVDHMRSHGLRSIEPTPAAAEAWAQEVADAVEGTLFGRADSWYVGANIPGKPRVFMVYVGGFAKYVQYCDAVAGKGYEGFVFDADSTIVPSPGDWCGPAASRTSSAVGPRWDVLGE